MVFGSGRVGFQETHYLEGAFEVVVENLTVGFFLSGELVGNLMAENDFEADFSGSLDEVELELIFGSLMRSEQGEDV